MAELKVLPDKVVGISSFEQLQCAMQSPSWNDLTNLEIKDVDLTQLQGPIVFGANLQTASIKNCTLGVSPTFNEGLQEVRLDNNAVLTTLSPLPGSLQKLFCRRTGLTHLPQLPEGLVTLAISNCALQDTPAQLAIPNFPDSLIYVDIQHNQVSRLPNLPPNLRTANFSHNQIQSIPALPNTLVRFFCSNNQLRVLPLLPANVELSPRYFSNNPLEQPYPELIAAWKTSQEAARQAAQTAGWNWQAVQQFDIAMQQAEQIFRDGIAQEKARVRQQGRNVAATRVLRQGVPRATGAEWYEGSETMQVPGGRTHPGPLNLIGSFLSGTEGGIAQQQAVLQSRAQGGARNHWTRRKGRKGRKGKRSSTR